jgi:hypothetical protein
MILIGYLVKLWAISVGKAYSQDKVKSLSKKIMRLDNVTPWTNLLINGLHLFSLSLWTFLFWIKINFSNSD